MRNDKREQDNWTGRKRWSPRNFGTYGFGPDSNDPGELPRGESSEPWGHNREFYDVRSEGYRPLGSRFIEAGLRDSYVGPRHHVQPSYHSRWDRSLHGNEQYSTRHGWSFGFESIPDEQRWNPSEGPHRGRGPKNYRRSDERIFEDVCERLTADGNIDASDIEVIVKEGEVTLRGSVSDRQSKHYAEDILEGVPGVHDIQNELRVTR